jgi:hypothetical protein
MTYRSMEISEYVLLVATGFGPTLVALEVASRIAGEKQIISGRKVAESIRKKVIGGRSGFEGGILAGVR